MDFIDWCHHVLAILEKQKFSQHLSDYEMPTVIFSEEITKQPAFHESNARIGMFDTLKLLSDVNLIEKGKWNWKITPLGIKVLANPVNYWTEICSEELDNEEETLLKLVNEYSPQVEENHSYGWLTKVNADKILLTFNVAPPPATTNEQMDVLRKYVYDLPDLLVRRGFLRADARGQYSTNLTSTSKYRTKVA